MYPLERPEILELYQSKENRDERARRLKRNGYIVQRTSDRGQLLHPRYVEDYGRKLSIEECGFGNTIYKTHFAVLYGIRAWR
ncbi:MAG: hypothetical protein DDT19_00256 [Syntrophomonadaceae bacterium]|nr:hypothetical protein [Bacillota bacterium]